MMSDEEDDVGIKFNPEDVELIRDYLIPKIKNEPCGDDGEYIVNMDVYAKEPWLLDHKNKDNFFMEDEWFYYATRTQVSKLKTGRGKNSNRTIINGGGCWKGNDGEKEIKDETGETIGMKEKLKFIKSDNNTASTTSTCVDSRWIMQEYKLSDGDKFQQLVLCKIYKKKENKSNKKDEAIATRDQEEKLLHNQVYPNPPPAYFSPGSSSLQRHEGQGQYSLQYYSDSDYTALRLQEAPVSSFSSQQQPINYSSPYMTGMNQELAPASYSQQQPIIYSSPYMLGMNQEESAPVFSSQQQLINEAHHSMIYGLPCMPRRNQEESAPVFPSQQQPIIYSSPYMLGMNPEEFVPAFPSQQQPIIYSSPYG